MMAEPIRAIEMHYPIIQLLINRYIYLIKLTALLIQTPKNQPTYHKSEAYI